MGSIRDQPSGRSPPKRRGHCAKRPNSRNEWADSALEVVKWLQLRGEEQNLTSQIRAAQEAAEEKGFAGNLAELACFYAALEPLNCSTARSFTGSLC